MKKQRIVIGEKTCERASKMASKNVYILGKEHKRHEFNQKRQEWAWHHLKLALNFLKDNPLSKDDYEEFADKLDTISFEIQKNKTI